MKKVLVYGAGMLGSQIAHLVDEHFSETHEIIGFIDDVRSRGELVLEKYKVLGGLDAVRMDKQYRPEIATMAFAIGYTNMSARLEAYHRAQKHGYGFESFVHPAASVDSSAIIGSGVVVLAQSVVDQFVTLGDVCYLHNGTIIGENCMIGSNNYFSAGSTLGGSIEIGHSNFFGMNVTVVDGLSIQNNNFFNAASLVYRDVMSDLRIVEFREQREVAK